MDEETVTLLIARIEDKDKEIYSRKYCHPNMHPSNYASIRVKRVKKSFLDALRSKNGDAERELKEEIGESGEYSIQQAVGGLGPKRAHETLEQYRARKPVSGMPEIARIRVD